MRVLVVEDEIRLAQALKHILEEAKYLPDIVHDGKDGYYYALHENYDLIVLDVMLPGYSGFEICKRLREAKIKTAILMLTAKDEIADKVAGLDHGADDYMTKPFSPEEFLARLRALARRPGELEFEELRFADLNLNLSSGNLTCGIKTVKLSHKELEILKILIHAKQAITPKESLLSKVWGADSDATDNNVEAYISFLRKKLTYLKSDASITAIRRLGYRLEESGLC